MQEVSAMEKKFDSWSQLPAPATAATDVKRAASAVTVSLPPAVAAFEVNVSLSPTRLIFRGLLWIHNLSILQPWLHLLH